jgi:metal-responsive CopG/Arc/MetJ family transcriptional regulator
MAMVKVAITIDAEVLRRLDALVKKRRFRSRSRAIQETVQEKLDKLARTRLTRECAKLDPKVEQAIADEDLAGALTEWPDY